MDKKLDDYQKTRPGPLGSTDRGCVVDSSSLVNALSEEDSELASLRAEKKTASWAKTLGATCHQFAPNVQGLGIPLVLISYSTDY